MKKILTDMNIDQDVLQRLRAIEGVEVEVIEDPQEEVRPLPPELIRDQQLLFCTYPPENFADMENVELIQISSAGYTQLYGLGLVEKKVRACNALGVFDVPIGEWCIAMMVNVARDLRQMIRNQDVGVWDRSAKFQREIRGLTLGIWGYGGIGREAARLAKATGIRVHALSRSGIRPRTNIYSVPGTGDPEGVLPDRIFLMDEKDEFLSGLDFLLLSMPQTDQTEGIVGEHELRCLPQTAFILNPARGPLIQEAPLLRALKEGWIAGAALDTHFHYPMPPDHSLWRMPNVIMTPHISGSALSPHFASRTWDIFAQNVERHLAGEPLLNELTPEQLDGA